MKESLSKIAILGATFETSNMGVSALTSGALTCVQHAYPKAEIFLLDYAHEPRIYRLSIGGKEHAVRLANLRFSKRFWLPNNVAWLLLLALLIRVCPFCFVKKQLLRRNSWLREIEATDKFAAISGGDSFSDIYGLVRLLYVALPQLLVLFLGKPLILLPQTIGPFKRRLSRRIAKFILKRAEIVYSRDLAGVDTTTRLLGGSCETAQVRFCNDVAFVMAPHCPAAVDVVGLPAGLPRPLVGINISGLLANSGYPRKMFGVALDYNGLVVAIIQSIVEKKEASVILIPHVFGQNEDSDVRACEKVYDSLKAKYGGRIGLLHGCYDQHQIKHIIGQCDFFIGSRMHACIAAVTLCIPAVSIAYSNKFIGVMKAVGLEELVADARKEDQGEILRIVEKAYEQRAILQRQLERKMRHVKKTVLDVFADLSSSPHSTEFSSDRAAH